MVGANLFTADDDVRDQPVFDHDFLDRSAHFEVGWADPLPRFGSIETAERDGGHAHLIRIFSRQEAEAEYLKPVRGGHAVEFFVNRADQHLAPETFDRAGGLAFFFQPFAHGDAIEIRARVLAGDGANGTGNV